MRRRATQRRRPAADTEARILPLINIVFLLLVFFLLAGRLEPASPVPATPPEAATEAPDRATPMRLHLGRDGALAIDGEIVPRDGLEAWLTERTGPQGLPAVRVIADAGAEASVLIGILDSLAAAGAAEALLVTRPLP